MKDRLKKLSPSFLVLNEGFWNFNKICKIYFVAQNAHKDIPDNCWRKGRGQTIQIWKKPESAFFELFAEYKIFVYIELVLSKQADIR